MNRAGTVTHQGCALKFHVTGEGPPVLFIQGTGIHGAGWKPQIDTLRKDYRCAYFDNRGMGQSQPLGSLGLTVELMTQDAVAVLDALGWASAHVVGHSLGGLVALHMALSERGRVRSLGLLCTFADGKVATRLTWPKFWLGMRSYLGTRRMRRAAFLQLVLSPDHFHSLSAAAVASAAITLEPLFGHDLASHPPVELKQLRAMSRYSALPRLNELSGLPTLVITASHDLIALPDHGRTMAKSIPGARLVELGEAAHGAPIQCAALVNQELSKHLNAAAGI